MATIATMATMATIKSYEPSTEYLWTWAKNVKLTDGSIYTGNLDRYGKRAGSGTLRTPIYVYGVIGRANTSSILTWMEYKGEWLNDTPNGWGIARKFRGDGTSTTIYKGIWQNGQPISDP